MFNQIKQLKDCLLTECKTIDDLIIERSRKLDMRHLLGVSFKYFCTKCSKDEAVNSLQLDGYLDASRQAIDKKLKLVEIEYLDNFLTNLRKHIYKIKIMEEGKRYAIDGTKIAIDKKSDKFKLTGNGNYKLGLLNVIYSIDNKIPIGYNLTESFDEIDSFLTNLLEYVKKKDILAFDRNYYSKKLITEINDKGAYFVCRMKKSSLLVKNIKENNLNENIQYVADYGYIRVIKYNIAEKEYYLTTNQFKYDIEYFKNIYHQRWSIEEFYKTIKCKMRLNKINSKNLLKVQQEITFQFIISTLARAFEALSNKYIKKKQHINRPINCNKTNNLNKKKQYERIINHSKTIFLLGDKTIVLLLFKGTIKKISRLLIVISKDKINSSPNRHFKRYCIRLISKWYLLKTKYFTNTAINLLTKIGTINT